MEDGRRTDYSKYIDKKKITYTKIKLRKIVRNLFLLHRLKQRGKLWNVLTKIEYKKKNEKKKNTRIMSEFSEHFLGVADSNLLFDKD